MKFIANIINYSTSLFGRFRIHPSILDQVYFFICLGVNLIKSALEENKLFTWILAKVLEE